MCSGQLSQCRYPRLRLLSQSRLEVKRRFGDELQEMKFQRAFRGCSLCSSSSNVGCRKPGSETETCVSRLDVHIFTLRVDFASRFAFELELEFECLPCIVVVLEESGRLLYATSDG